MDSDRREEPPTAYGKHSLQEHDLCGSPPITRLSGGREHPERTAHYHDGPEEVRHGQEVVNRLTSDLP